MALTHQEELEKIQSFKGKYPKQIWPLFFSEMWERFCFYGMRGMLMYFMTYELLLKEDLANLQYGATQAWVYAFTFIGGLFADKILGFRKSLFWGGLLMIIGSIILAIDPREYFFIGIAFNIVGTGFFKPNISSMVGKLYKDGDPRRDLGFSLFYAGINLGAFLGGYICISIGKSTMLESVIPKELSWNVAFGLAAIAMTISLITFIFTKRTLGPIGLSPFEEKNIGGKKWMEYLVYAGALACIPAIMVMVANTKYTDYFMYVIGPFSLIYLAYEMTKLNAIQNKRLIAAMAIIIFSVVFWAIFEQAGGSLSAFSSKHISILDLGFIKIDQNGVNNAANSIFVILFATVVGFIWLALAKRKMEPSTVNKFGIGFLFLGIGFLVFYSIKFFAGADAIAGMDMFILGYFVVTIAELCLSPIGLSAMTKLAPNHLQGFMMGMWFLASAYGQYVAGIFGAGIAPKEGATPIESISTYTAGYFNFAWYAIIAGVLLILISPLIKKLMGGVK
jgi:POT family proton-dependent oligopeptide transporter